MRPEDRQRARRLHPGGSNNNQRGDGLAQRDHSLERALSAKTVVGRLAVAGLGTDPPVLSLKQRLWGRLSVHTRTGAQYQPPGRLTGPMRHLGASGPYEAVAVAGTLPVRRRLTVIGRCSVEPSNRASIAGTQRHHGSCEPATVAAGTQRCQGRSSGTRARSLDQIRQFSAPNARRQPTCARAGTERVQSGCPAAERRVVDQFPGMSARTACTRPQTATAHCNLADATRWAPVAGLDAT